MSDKDRFGNKDSEESHGRNFNENTTLSRKEYSKKSKNSVLAEGSGSGSGGRSENSKNDTQYQGLSSETQKLIESLKNNNNSNSKKKDVPQSKVEEILREAKLKAASRGIDVSNFSTKPIRDNRSDSSNSNNNNKVESRKLSKSSPSAAASSSNSNCHNDDSLSESDHDKILTHEPKQDSGSFMADEWIDDKSKSKKSSKGQQQTEITKNNDVSQTSRPQSRFSRLANLIGIGSNDESKQITDDSNNIVTEKNTNNDEFSENVGDDNNANSSNKQKPNMTIDTTLERPIRKETRYTVKPRLTKKRAVLRRSSARLVHSPSEYQRSSVKTVETSELDEINAQFEETLNEFSKRYQDSTVALAEKSHLLKRNQELHHTLASKEEEIEYLKNELWEAGNKIQNYESDLKDIIEQQQEPLALTHEDLIRIEREIENQEVLVSSYQKENDKLVDEIKTLNERLKVSEAEQEKQLNKAHELYREVEHFKELLYEKETQGIVPEGTTQQIEELKKEIEQLREKEKTYEFKELALKEMDNVKKELSDLRDRESEYMIKIDDMEHQLSLARDEIEAVSQERTESLEKMTEEMNIMKYTYESQIEGVKREAIAKDGRETRFRKLQTAIEKIEGKLSSNSEVTQICTELRRGNLLAPKKRRKSTVDTSKNNREMVSPRSPTTRSLKKTTSTSSLGGMSRASAVTSPTPSVLSSVSALSGRDELMELQDELPLDISSEEYAEMKVKIIKLEEENKSSHESTEKLEDELKLLQQVKIKLEEELEALKKEHAERKEQYDQKMREMEELLLELPADSAENSMAANVSNNPIITQPVVPSNLLKELETKQNIIEELVDKLKRKEEQLEYYQNAYLLKTTEFEDYVEKVKNANQTGVNGGTDVEHSVAVGDIVTTPNVDSSSAIEFLNDAIPFGDDVIGNLIAQLERTIDEKTMQLDAAHQRATDAETKLLALSREKMSWGSGYDTTVKQLKTQVAHLQELLQMERKAARLTTVNEKISVNDTKNESKNEKTNLNGTKLTPGSTTEIQKLRGQIESLTAENITLKAQLTTSEAVRQAVHENTLTILQQTTKTNLAADEDIAGLRKLAMEKEAEIGIWKGRCVGLENVVERQRVLLTLVVPSLPENNSINGKPSDVSKLLVGDGIDSKVIEGLNETARQLVQRLQEENAILRQTIVAHKQMANKKVDVVYDALPQYTSPISPRVNPTNTPTTVQLDALAKQISEIETRFIKREKELQDIIAETKRQGELQLERWKAKWGAIIDKKNSEIRGFRSELEALMKCLGKLDSVNVNGMDNGVI